MNDLDIVTLDESAEFPDNPGVDVSGNVQREDVDVMQVRLLGKPTPPATGKPHSMPSLLKLAGDLKCLNLQSSPRLGETGLQYVECLMKRHMSNHLQTSTRRF
jgi:hypothetical protein